jgi:ABC-2 type transport system permease protein
MRRYFRILRIFVRTALVRDIEFRAAFFIEVFYPLVWLTLFFGVIQIFYSHTKSIAGWDKAALIVLLGVWSFIDDLGSGTFWRGVIRLPELVAEGKLDFLLVKPVDSQFMIAAERFVFARVILIVADIGLIAYGLSLGTIGSWWMVALAFPIFVITGYAILFSFFYIFHTLGFWYLRIENIWALAEGFENIGKYPIDIFGRHVKLISLTVVPLAVIFMFPAQALVGSITVLELLYAPVVAVIFLAFARWFYQKSVRRYSSVA